MATSMRDGMAALAIKLRGMADEIASHPEFDAHSKCAGNVVSFIQRSAELADRCLTDAEHDAIMAQGGGVLNIAPVKLETTRHVRRAAVRAAKRETKGTRRSATAKRRGK